MEINPKPQTSRTYRYLALGALGLGFFAIFAESPSPFTVTVDLQELAANIEREEDHFSASELAHLIIRGSDRLRIIDIRDPASYAKYHIPGAVRFDLPSLLRARFTPKDTIVIYSDGGIHASQAWFLLQMRGMKNAYTLRGGLDLWNDQVLSPVIDPAMPPAQRDSMSALAAYFGGAPVRETTTELSVPRHKREKPPHTERERERIRDGC